MPLSSTSTALSSSCFPEKPKVCIGKLPFSDSVPETPQISLAGHGVRDSLMTSSSSFDRPGDVDHEFYSRDTDQDNDGNEDSEINHPDIPARTLSVDRFFASNARVFSESGFSLSAMTGEDEDEENEEDEDEEDEEDEEDADFAAITSGSSNARSLVDRIFAGGCAPSRYRVASVPSLAAIEENEESNLEENNYAQTSPGSHSDECTSTPLSTVESEHFDGVASSHPDWPRLSQVSFSTLDEDDQILGGDSDSGWVWVERKDSEIAESGTVQLARSCEARKWGWRRAIRRFFAV